MFKAHLLAPHDNVPERAPPRPRQARTRVRSHTVVVRNPLGGTLVDIIRIIERSRQERQRLLFLQTEYARLEATRKAAVLDLILARDSALAATGLVPH